MSLICPSCGCIRGLYPHKSDCTFRGPYLPGSVGAGGGHADANVRDMPHGCAVALRPSESPHAKRVQQKAIDIIRALDAAGIAGGDDITDSALFNVCLTSLCGMGVPIADVHRMVDLHYELNKRRGS